MIAVNPSQNRVPREVFEGWGVSGDMEMKKDSGAGVPQRGQIAASIDSFVLHWLQILNCESILFEFFQVFG